MLSRIQFHFVGETAPPVVIHDSQAVPRVGEVVRLVSRRYPPRFGRVELVAWSVSGEANDSAAEVHLTPMSPREAAEALGRPTGRGVGPATRGHLASAVAALVAEHFDLAEVRRLASMIDDTRESGAELAAALRRVVDGEIEEVDGGRELVDAMRRLSANTGG